MLKKIIAFISICLLLTGCRPVSTTLVSESNDYSIAVYKGEASLSILGLLNSDNTISPITSLENYNYEFVSGENDLIIGPINAGLTKISEGANYKLLSIVGYGDYAISLVGETITGNSVGACETGTVIEEIINYFASTDLNSYNFTYYNSYDELMDAYNNGEVSYMLLDKYHADYFEVTNNVELNEVSDIQEIYELTNVYESFPVYGVFVKSDIASNDQNSLAGFITTFRSSINSLTNASTDLSELIGDKDLESFGLTNNLDVLKKAYEDCQIKFTYASNDLENLNAYYRLFDKSIPSNYLVN